MVLWTLSSIKTKVKNDLDLTGETMITDAEMNGYVNQAKDEAEQVVLGLSEDYFLQKASLPITSGTSDYTLPSNIYAHKIRRIIYDNGSYSYEVKKLRNIANVPLVLSTDVYRYLVYMSSAGVPTLTLYPAAQETSATNLTIWFIGNSNDLSVDTDIMNLPEAVQFVIAKTKLECARKEGHPAQSALEQEVENQRTLLKETLSTMTPDEDNKITLDLSYYDDQDFGGY